MKTKDEKKVLNEEETIVKAAPVQETKAVTASEAKKSGAWKSVLVGGVPGIIFGVAGTLATEGVAAAADAEENEELQDETTGGGGSASVHDVAPVAEGVNDDMSFSEAFAAARAEVGPGGVFSWHGQVYGTYYKPEWDAMSDEQRHDYSHSVAQAQVHPEPYTPQQSDPPIIEDNADTDDIGNQHEASYSNEDSDNVVNDDSAAEPELEVEIIGVTQVEDENGDLHDLGVGTVDGHDAAFLDLEGDGEVDTVIIDENDNGEVDIDEVYDAGGSGISMSDMIAQADYGGAAPDDGLYNDMPDYTNDADTSSLA